MNFLTTFLKLSSAKPDESKKTVKLDKNTYEIKKQLLSLNITLKDATKKNDALRNSENSWMGTLGETPANSPIIAGNYSPCLTDATHASSASPILGGSAKNISGLRASLKELHLLTHEPHPNSFLKNKSNHDSKRQDMSTTFSIFSPSRPPSISRLSDIDSMGMGSPSPRPNNLSSRERAQSGASRPSSCSIIYLHSPPHSPLRNTPKTKTPATAFSGDVTRNSIDKMTPETMNSSMISSHGDMTDIEEDTTVELENEHIEDDNDFSFENFHISELKSPRSPERSFSRTTSCNESIETTDTSSSLLPQQQQQPEKKLSRLQELKLLEQKLNENMCKDEEFPLIADTIKGQNVNDNVLNISGSLDIDLNNHKITNSNLSPSEKNALLVKKLIENHKETKLLKEMSMSQKDKEDAEEKQQQSDKQLKHYSTLFKNQFMLTTMNTASEKRTPRIEHTPRGISPLGGQVLRTSNKATKSILFQSVEGNIQ